MLTFSHTHLILTIVLVLTKTCAFGENVFQNLFNDLVDESLRVLEHTEACLFDPLHLPDHQSNQNSGSWRGKIVTYNVEDIVIHGLSKIRRIGNLEVELISENATASHRKTYAISTKLGFNNFSLSCNINICPLLKSRAISVPIDAIINNLIFKVVLEFTPSSLNSGDDFLLQIRELSPLPNTALELQISSKNQPIGEENKMVNFVLKHSQSFINSKVESNLAKYLAKAQVMANTLISSLIDNKLKQNGKCEIVEKVRQPRGETGQCSIA